MSDKKLDKLIEEYGKEYVSYCDEQISHSRKAKQAIIDYHDKCVRDAYDDGYEKAVELWKEADKKR